MGKITHSQLLDLVAGFRARPRTALPYVLPILIFALSIALSARPCSAAANQPVDFDVVPADWMGLAEDLAFRRVNAPLAELPTFRSPHYLSHPEPVAAELATLPSLLVGRAPGQSVTVQLAQLPALPIPRFASHPVPQIVVLAALPAELLSSDGRPASTLGSIPPSLQFVMSAVTDPLGNQWIGCEDSGVFRYTPSTGQWRQFTTADGLGDDNAYALAVDKLGRVWVGHLNHGVSVYNGQTWKNYEVVAGLSRPDTLAGPLGERIFKIAVNPADGDVWIASSAGLARYSGNGVPPLSGSVALSPSPTSRVSASFEPGHWSYYSRAEGLPSDQAQALAFAPDGTLYVGTQCDGIAIACPKDNYATWRTVQAPDPWSQTSDPASRRTMPTVPHGDGLPTNLINDLLVAKDGTVYVATTLGLAESKDAGRSWHYWRGRDYADKVRGLYGGPPKDWQEQPGAWLAEDYITCLAQDAQGNLLIGYRQQGYQLTNPATGQCLSAGVNPQDYITALLPQPDGSTLIGSYGQSVRTVAVEQASSLATVPSTSQSPISNSQISNPSVPFPTAAQPPTEAELATLIARLRSIPATTSTDKPLVVPLADDWTTRGDWLGRYGKYWACTTAMDYNYLWGAGAQPVGYHCQIGPHAEQTDSLRYWIAQLSTDLPCSLEMPPVYLHSRVLRGETTWDKYRRQAEHDDHGEAYPMTHEGPNIYYSLSIPPGLYTLSFYNTNNDGRGGLNRTRDYRFSVRPFAGQPDRLLLDDPQQAGRSSRSSYVSLDGFAGCPELASARQRDFSGGAYKRFLVRGPSALTIEIARNGSLNTLNAGLFLDEALTETPDPYFPISNLKSPISNPEIPDLKSTDLPLAELSYLAQRNPSQWAIHQPLYTQLLRSSVSNPQSPVSNPEISNPHVSRLQSSLATCYFQSHQFPVWESIQKAQGLTTAREIEKALRWDQKTFACTGKGRQIVQAYLAANARPTTQPTAEGNLGNVFSIAPAGAKESSPRRKPLGKDVASGFEPQRGDTKAPAATVLPPKPVAARVVPPDGGGRP